VLVFEAGGVELAYEDLSGGEREVAFLVGQVERFGMRSGLFLVDEPELHLNAELLRTWLAYLRTSVEGGQVWIATHSLEAVEVAGLDATLVCERDSDTRLVHNVLPLGERPALATLAGHLGSPAFSLLRSRFVLIEGDRPGRERERFTRLLDASATVRFLESGGCQEVLAKLDHIRVLASEEEQIRIGAIVDRDMRTAAAVAEISGRGAFVLPVTEIENFYLYPALLVAIARQAGIAEASAQEHLRDAADRLVGTWIFERARGSEGWSEELGPAAAHARQVTLTEIEADPVETTKAIARLMPDLPDPEVARRALKLRDGLAVWQRVRLDPTGLWRECFGKEALRDVARAFDLSSSEAYEKRAWTLWDEGIVSRPDEVQTLRAYVEGLALVGV
jgi:hypothetical protein